MIEKGTPGNDQKIIIGGQTGNRQFEELKEMLNANFQSKDVYEFNVADQ